MSSVCTLGYWDLPGKNEFQAQGPVPLVDTTRELGSRSLSKRLQLGNKSALQGCEWKRIPLRYCSLNVQCGKILTSAPGLTGLGPTPLLSMTSVPRKEKVPPLLGDSPQRLAS